MIANPACKQKKASDVNVGRAERWASAALGTGLVVAGAMRWSWAGLAMAAGGGVLLNRGLSGQCSLYRALGIGEKPSRGPEARQSAQSPPPDAVAEASDESFPASDAPSFTSTSIARRQTRPIVESR